jgi:hypothetical protein
MFCYKLGTMYCTKEAFTFGIRNGVSKLIANEIQYTFGLNSFY